LPIKVKLTVNDGDVIKPKQIGESQMAYDLYTQVTARILAELEQGVLPWVKPWRATAGANTPCNAVTNRPYSGTNVVLLWIAGDSGGGMGIHRNNGENQYGLTRRRDKKASATCRS
jgi:hypothetical protein